VNQTKGVVQDLGGIITLTILFFLLFVMYAMFFSLGFRMRLELAGGLLLPGSKSQVNQQVVLNQVNRFFLEISRNVRNASKITILNPSRIRVVIGSASTDYYLKEYISGGKTVKAIVRLRNSEEQVLVQGVDDFQPTLEGSRSVKLTVKATVGGKVQVFQINLLQRNPSSSA
jgi:hypothetical protein